MSKDTKTESDRAYQENVNDPNRGHVVLHLNLMIDLCKHHNPAVKVDIIEGEIIKEQLDSK